MYTEVHSGHSAVHAGQNLLYLIVILLTKSHKLAGRVTKLFLDKSNSVRLVRLLKLVLTLVNALLLITNYLNFFRPAPPPIDSGIVVI